MNSARVKLNKLQRWKDKKPYNERLTSLYWRYWHKLYVHIGWP